MKKQVIILVSIILISYFSVGCSNNKQNPEDIENADINSIETGKYYGQAYNMTSSFIPKLSLENSNTFNLELGINKSIKGTYTIDNNKLVLTSNDGNESYTFEIKKNTLIIEQGISNYVKKNTNFKLIEQKN